MPVSKSAKRALRKSERRRERNLYHLTRMRNAIRLFKKRLEELKGKQIDEKLRQELEKELRKVISVIQHVASKGVIHKNEGRRRISRITKLFNKFLQNAGPQ